MTTWTEELKSPISYLLLESGDYLLLENADQIILEQTGRDVSAWSFETKN